MRTIAMPLAKGAKPTISRIRRAACQQARNYREANKQTVSAREKAYRQANKEIVATRKKKYYEANKQKLLSQKRAYHSINRQKRLSQKRDYWARVRAEHLPKRKMKYAENKETVLAQQKKYYSKNRESIATRVHARYLINKLKIIARIKTWNETPDGRAARKANRHKRRSRGQFAFNTLVTKADLLHWETSGAVCYLTGVPLLPGKVTWDHVVPLYYGGTGDWWNFLPASRSANSTKHDRLVYFDLATREPRYTLDPCPGGPTWPRIPLTQPTMDEMQAMVDAWKARRQQKEAQREAA